MNDEKYLNSKNEHKHKSAVGALNSKLWEFPYFLSYSGNLRSITYSENGSKLHWHIECQQPVFISLPSFPFGVQRKPYTNERAKRASFVSYSEKQSCGKLIKTVRK